MFSCRPIPPSGGVVPADRHKITMALFTSSNFTVKKQHLCSIIYLTVFYRDVLIFQPGFRAESHEVFSLLLHKLSITTWSEPTVIYPFISTVGCSIPHPIQRSIPSPIPLIAPRCYIHLWRAIIHLKSRFILDLVQIIWTNWRSLKARKTWWVI